MQISYQDASLLLETITVVLYNQAGQVDLLHGGEDGADESVALELQEVLLFECLH